MILSLVLFIGLASGMVLSDWPDSEIDLPAVNLTTTTTSLPFTTDGTAPETTDSPTSTSDLPAFTTNVPASTTDSPTSTTKPLYTTEKIGTTEKPDETKTTEKSLNPLEYKFINVKAEAVPKLAKIIGEKKGVANYSIPQPLLNLSQDGGYIFRSYSFGERPPDDCEVLAFHREEYRWDNKKDVVINIGYPGIDIGTSKITAVDVLVWQKSNQSSAVITEGAINSNKINVQVEAGQTTYFYYESSIYGTN